MPLNFTNVLGRKFCQMSTNRCLLIYEESKQGRLTNDISDKTYRSTGSMNRSEFKLFFFIHFLRHPVVYKEYSYMMTGKIP